MRRLETQNQRVGFALVTVGVLLLIVRFSWNIGWLWPLFILVPGVALLVAAALGGASVSALFVPGSVVTTLGIIFFFQNATDYFESWVYVWALLPAAVGVGLLLYGQRSGNLELVKTGRRLAGVFTLIFLVGILFFEGFIFNNVMNTWFFRTGLPLLCIAGGAFLLLRQRVDEP